jgi:HEAT repeat protein
MTDIEILEKRWAELASKPKTKEEIEETLLLAKQIELERTKEYKGLIDELADLDIKINSIWDLVNTKSKYPKAIPVLMKYLPLVNYVRNKEGIVRALTVPEAKGLVVPLLVKEYLQLPIDKENLRWVIGNAVSATITESEVANIFPIVLNKENGLSRQMFVTAMGKIKTDNVKSVLLQLSNDDDKVIRDEAKKALKKVS